MSQRVFRVERLSETELALHQENGQTVTVVRRVSGCTFMGADISLRTEARFAASGLRLEGLTPSGDEDGGSSSHLSCNMQATHTFYAVDGERFLGVIDAIRVHIVSGAQEQVHLQLGLDAGEPTRSVLQVNVAITYEEFAALFRHLWRPVPALLRVEVWLPCYQDPFTETVPGRPPDSILDVGTIREVRLISVSVDQQLRSPLTWAGAVQDVPNSAPPLATRITPVARASQRGKFGRAVAVTGLVVLFLLGEMSLRSTAVGGLMSHLVDDQLRFP